MKVSKNMKRKMCEEIIRDLLVNIDNIKPKIDLVLGINNRMGFVSTQALFDYLDRLKKKIIEDEKKWG